jgi:hypothetical protein
MLQIGFLILFAGFILGIVGVGLHKDLEDIVFEMLTGSVDVSSYTGSWKVLVGLLLLFVIPVASFSVVYYMFYSDNPQKRLLIIERSKKFVLSLVLISISFYLYQLLLVFTAEFADTALILVTTDTGFKQTIFYNDFTSIDIDASKLLESSYTNQTLLDIFKTGTYTISLLFLIATLGFQKLLTRFGVILLPLAFFIYNLPFNTLEKWSVQLIKGITLVLLIPFIDILLLTVNSVSTPETQVGEITYILGFLAVSLINWSLIKKVVKTSTNQTKDAKPFKYMAKRYYRKNQENKENVN